MKLTASQKLAWSWGLALFFVAAAGWHAWHAARQQAAAARWVAQSYRTLSSLATLHHLNHAAENAFRSSLRSSQVLDLVQFEKAIASLRHQLEAVGELTAGQTEQQRRLNHLGLTADDCHALVQHALAFARARDISTALLLLQSDGARVLRSRLDQLIAETVNHELQLLPLRTAAAERAQTRALSAVFLQTIAALGLIALAARKLVRARNERMAKACEHALAVNQAKTALEAEVQQRQRLEQALDPAPAQHPVPPEHKRGRLLLVDDDPALRGILQQVLERANFTVATADSGYAALELMRQQAPDLVVLDLAMPDLDGAATLGQIRHGWSTMPVILHTGFAEGDLMERARTFSPFKLLIKPCPPQQLIATVRELVAATPKATKPTKASGDEPTLLTA